MLSLYFFNNFCYNIYIKDKEGIEMRIKITVDWPWSEVEPDTAEIEVEDDLDNYEVELIAKDYAEDMIMDRASYYWEEVE